MLTKSNVLLDPLPRCSMVLRVEHQHAWDSHNFKSSFLRHLC